MAKPRCSFSRRAGGEHCCGEAGPANDRHASSDLLAPNESDERIEVDGHMLRTPSTGNHVDADHRPWFLAPQVKRQIFATAVTSEDQEAVELGLAKVPAPDAFDHLHGGVEAQIAGADRQRALAAVADGQKTKIAFRQSNGCDATQFVQQIRRCRRRAVPYSTFKHRKPVDEDMDVQSKNAAFPEEDGVSFDRDT